jgi:hypothetical protein
VNEFDRITPQDWPRFWLSSGAVMNVWLWALRRSGISDCRVPICGSRAAYG